MKKSIPSGWQEKELLDCLRVPSKLAGIKLSEYKKDGVFPVFDQGQDYISGFSSNENLVVKDVPAILFGDHTRIVKYIKRPFVAGADGTKIFWAKDGFDSTFLYYLVLNQKIPNTGYNRHFKFFKDIKVIIPESKTEQQKIAEILGTVDEDIAKTQEVIAATEKLKRGLMQELFTRGIPSFAKATDGKGQRKFKETKIGQIPEGWEVKSLGMIFKLSSGATPLRSNKAYFEQGLIPWVKTMDLNNSIISKTQENITDLAVKKTNCKILPKDTILIAMYGGFNQIGRTGVLAIEAATNQAITALLPKNNISSIFVNYYLIAFRDRWKNFATSSRKDPNITKGDITSFDMVLPTFTEQQDIARILSVVDEKISVNKKLKEKLILLKKGLMEDLLSGKVRVVT